MNNDSKNSIPIIPVSDVPSRPLNEDNEIFQNSKDGVNMGPSNRNKKSVAVKKLEKRIIRLTAQAITDFGMIEDGARVLVAMRGGTDGSFISTQGVITPNYFTGGHNFHSNCEFLPLGAAVKSTEVTLTLIDLIAGTKH